jgi:hypothetical protein
MEDQRQKFFFSYSRDDSKFVLKLAENMRTEGLDLWIDQLDIPSGARWDETVEGALKACPGFLVVLSPSSVASPNVMDEVAFAIQRNKKILPILHKNCEVPFRISRLQFIDFTGDYGEAFAKLLKAANAPARTDSTGPVAARGRLPQGTRNKRLLVGVLLVAVLGTVAAGFAAYWGKSFSSTCAARSGYPVGRWSVEVRDATVADYSRYVDFETASSGIWEYGGKKGTFATEPKVAPGDDVILTYSQLNDRSYHSSNRLRVSPDGCTMKGQFSDGNANGTVIYTYEGDKSKGR